jgi:arabinofuranosyltransferase
MTDQPPFRIPPLLALLLLTGLAAFVSWANFGFAYDDAFITYRVAYNFASGQGLVYNPGEWYPCSTSPGLALLLGLGGKLFGAEAVPLISSILSPIALWLVGIALYVYGARQGHAASGLFAGLLLIANQMMAFTSGGEMPLQMALIMWAFVAYLAEWPIATGLLLAAATVVRPDGVMAAAVLGLFDLIRTRRLAWRIWLTFAIALLPFLVLTWIYYGTPLPNSLAAKLAHRDAGVWVTFGKRLRVWLNEFTGPSGQPATWEFLSWDPRALGFWVAIGLPAMIWARAWWLPVAWTIAFTLAYRQLHVPFYHWYAAPPVLGLVIIAAVGLETTMTFLIRRSTPRRLVPIAAMTLAIAWCFAINLTTLRTLRITSRQHTTLQIYEQAGRWLDANTPPAATVGYFEIGYLGYYAHRRIVDPLGLVDPAIPPHIAQRDFLWAYREHPPDYILEKSGNSFGGILTEAWFTRDYQQIHTFTHPQSDVSVTLFQRVAGRPAVALH